MIGPDHYKLFLQLRLSPWVPAHEKLIRGYLAMYEVEAPEKAAELKLRYDERLKRYQEDNALLIRVAEEERLAREAEAALVETPAEAAAPVETPVVVTETTVTTIEKPKKKKKKKVEAVTFPL